MDGGAAVGPWPKHPIYKINKSDKVITLLVSSCHIIFTSNSRLLSSQSAIHLDFEICHSPSQEHHVRISTKMTQNYKEIAAIALERREAAIPGEYLLPEESLTNLPRNLTTVPKSSGHFTAEELEIIETSAEDILLKIKEKRWTSLEVTKAFCKASVVAQQLVCSLRPMI
jgi:hypothetical protein